MVNAVETAVALESERYLWVAHAKAVRKGLSAGRFPSQEHSYCCTGTTIRASKWHLMGWQRVWPHISLSTLLQQLVGVVKQHR